MSVLSQKFVEKGFHLEHEATVGPITTRLWLVKESVSVMVDVTPGRSLLLSVGDFPGWTKILASAQTICARFMGADPICSFDAQPSLVWTHFVEWELQHPEARLRTIVNRGEDLMRIPFRNLLLFGQYCVRDFEDADLQRTYSEIAELSRRFPGVCGKDPGKSCNALRVLRADEFGLFLEYNLLELARLDQAKYRQASRPEEDILVRLIHGMTMSEIQERELILALDFVAAQICEKVGIPILAEPSANHRLRFDEGAFMNWFNNHSRRLVLACPDDATLGKVFEAYQLGEDVSQYAPK